MENTTKRQHWVLDKQEFTNMTADENNTLISSQKMTIIKNLVIICLSFLLSFTAFSGTVDLQSSMDTTNETGNTTLIFLNLAAIISNLFLASLVLYKLGLKWTLIISLFLHVALTASNFYQAWYSLYIGAFITGLSAGPLWSSKSAYLTILGEKYAALSGELPEAVISRFFGIFFMTYRGSMVTGNLMESFIIQRPSSSNLLSDDIIRGLCGAHYCYEDLDEVHQESFNATRQLNCTVQIPSFYHPSRFQIILLFGIYVLCGITAIPLIAMTDCLNTNSSESFNVKQAIMSTFHHMRNPKEILLIPLALLSGVTYAFITADYCVGFITCSFGINNIGYIMSMFGLVAAISSITTGPMLKYTGRQAIFAFGGLCNVLALTGMLIWLPAHHNSVFLYVFSGLWGIANSVWTSQLVALIGFMFHDGPKEAAFICNYLWQMSGICLWHAISRYICLYIQLYIIAGILLIGLACYAIMELMIWKETALANNAKEVSFPSYCDKKITS